MGERARTLLGLRRRWWLLQELLDGGPAVSLAVACSVAVIPTLSFAVPELDHTEVISPALSHVLPRLLRHLLDAALECALGNGAGLICGASRVQRYCGVGQSSTGGSDRHLLCIARSFTARRHGRNDALRQQLRCQVGAVLYTIGIGGDRGTLAPIARRDLVSTSCLHARSRSDFPRDRIICGCVLLGGRSERRRQRMRRRTRRSSDDARHRADRAAQVMSRARDNTSPADAASHATSYWRRLPSKTSKSERGARGGGSRAEPCSLGSDVRR